MKILVESMIINYFGFNMDVRDIEKILSDLNLRECILYSHKRNIQDLMIALVDAKQSNFSWGGERLYQKS